MRNSDLVKLTAGVMVDAVASAEKAIDRFPQPNYVCAKIGEEAGETIRAYIHMVEGRGSPEELRGEAVQLIGLVLRLLLEGDQTIEPAAPNLGGRRSS